MRPLYREPDNGLIFGVCAGISVYTGIPANGVRLLWIGSNLFLPGTFFMYFVLAIVLRKNPNSHSLKKTDKALSSVQHLKEHTEQLNTQLTQIRQQVVHLENYVTSDEFQFKRKLWDLQNEEP